MSFLSILLEAAFGRHPSVEFERISPEDEIYPEDGIIYAPELMNENPLPSGGLYLGPQINLYVSAGTQVVGGQPLAEIETSAMVIEVVSPCTSTVENVMVQNGDIVT